MNASFLFLFNTTILVMPTAVLLLMMMMTVVILKAVHRQIQTLHRLIVVILKVVHRQIQTLVKAPVQRTLLLILHLKNRRTRRWKPRTK